MFQQGDKVVLGVSGGADSVCLLFVLMELQEILGIHLHVVHVNHGIREDAARDAVYVENLCREKHIPFLLEEVSVEELARDLGLGCEEAGRIARYKAFEKACRLYGCSKVAVAHNSNDRAETMLFHLFRGTGLKGLAGILPVRDNIVRPLLCLERREIEAYLEERGISYQQDSTNATDEYARNRIRHHILPYAGEYITGACVANMNRTADILAREEEYLQEQAQKGAACCMITTPQEGVWPEELELSVEAFLQQHPVMQTRILLMLLKQLSPKQQDITAVHIEQIQSLFLEQGNRQINLPYGIRGERSYTKVRLTRQKKEKGEALFEGIRIAFPEGEDVFRDGHEVCLPGGARMTFKILENPYKTGDFQGISENLYTKWLDYDTILGMLQVRTRQTGDYLMISSKEGPRHKRLKDYMIGEKIPREERDQIPLLAEGAHILWVVGHRISEAYKVTAATTRILEVEYKP